VLKDQLVPRVPKEHKVRQVYKALKAPSVFKEHKVLQELKVL
jgi:hypothetical protein